jgi:hypothetical protein
MATATKQKAGKKTDLDKDVQSLMELQEKLSTHAGLCQMVGYLRVRLCTYHGVTASRPCSTPPYLSADAAADAVSQVAAAAHRAVSITAQ